MKITVLGTSSMVPTKERNVTSIYLEHNGEGILIDCGEGTQRQMTYAGIPRTKVKKVFITHWHGDHTSGLVGLIQTIGHSMENAEIEVYGPIGTKEYMHHLMNSCSFYNQVGIKIIEINAGKLKTIINNSEYQVQAINLEHSIPCIGYSFIQKDKYNINVKKAEILGIKPGPLMGELTRKGEVIIGKKTIKIGDVATVNKGKKISFIFDTRLVQNCFILAKDADLLISESSFAHGLSEKADEFKHLTTKDAATIAIEANVKKLMISHYSQRYKTTEQLKEELDDFFPNNIVAYDLMTLKI